MHSAARLARGDARIIDLFRERLNIVQADTRELLDMVFRLRYQVYCLERSFENSNHFPDGRERDDDDLRSTHSLLLFKSLTRPGQTAVGTVRLILPRRGTDLPALKLLSDQDRHKLNFPLESTAEISRFAVPRKFRRCLENDLNDSLQNRLKSANADRRIVNLLSFSLIRAVTTMALNKRMTHLVAMMEPALLRLISALGIPFHPMGQIVEHHGLRQPCWTAMANLGYVRRNHPDLWELAFFPERGSAMEPAFAYG